MNYGCDVEVKSLPYYRWGTSLEVTGKKTEVESFIKAYKRDWHPAGYGTSFTDLIDNDNGTVTTVITRADSCD